MFISVLRHRSGAERRRRWLAWPVWVATWSLVFAPTVARADADPWYSPVTSTLAWASETLDTTLLSNQPFFDMSPTLHLNVALYNDLLNLTPAPNPNVVQLGPDTGGYRITRFRRFEGGIGQTFNFNFVGDVAEGVVPFLGLLPMFGTSFEEVRYVKKPDDADKLPTVRSYPSESYVKKLKKGEHLKQQLTGGVLFTAGVGFYGLALSTRYLARGEWQVDIEKLDGNEVYVKLTKSKIHSFNANFGALLLGISSERFGSTDNFFSFRVDMGSKLGAKVYHDLIRGNLTKAQELAALPDQPVKLDTSAKVIEAGTLSRFWYGLVPVLGGEMSKGKVHTVANEWQYGLNRRMRVDQGVSIIEKQTRVFARKRHTINLFYGTYATNRENEPADGMSPEEWNNPDKSERDRPSPSEGEPEFLGTFFWLYEDNRTDGASLKDHIARLIRDTGMERELLVGTPSKDQELRFTAVRFAFTMGTEATWRLLKIGQRPDVINLLRYNLWHRIHAYFDRGFDPQGVCKGVDSDLKDCREELIQDSYKAADAMAKALRDMSRERLSSRRRFVKAYAEFGRAMTENQFTFGVVRRFLGQSPVRISYDVQGEKISNLRRVYGTVPEPISTDAHPHPGDFPEGTVNDISNIKKR